ncbi:TetR/AcrR family transcriptional regulator [Lewinella sp. 4G2]|uniref:TetR/AcrR family transcriptional regulator n=1 Tax=Lewinella sp. 4G2 TaxID=1803372 RepID=UPI0007B48122|nr:TetR/AcrR family transcriptional regulator [Lewinella sp. 4G2]OAV44051.1 hypothetical protein A3850_005870 [Lewinella sp. 4G2]
MSEVATQTEEKILQAAEKIFQEKGYAGTRMQAVADEAGINKAMLHYYFRSKEKLFRVILTKAINEVSPVLISSLNSDKDVMGKLRDLVANHIRLLLERPHLPLFIMHELSQNQGKFVTDMAMQTDAPTTIMGFFQQVMEEGQAGKIRLINPIHLILNVMSLVVFPFVARPMVVTVAGVPEEMFRQVLEERTEEVLAFVAGGLRP